MIQVKEFCASPTTEGMVNMFLSKLDGLGAEVVDIKYSTVDETHVGYFYGNILVIYKYNSEVLFKD